MNSSTGLRADYGVDAPTLVVGLFIGGFACILTGSIFHIFGDHLPRALVISLFISGVAAGSLMLVGAALTLWGSKFGKIIVR